MLLSAVSNSDNGMELKVEQVKQMTCVLFGIRREATIPLRHSVYSWLVGSIYETDPASP